MPYKEKIGVLIVEDDEDFIFLVTAMLKADPQISFVRSAKDKETAVTVAEAARPDVVLMDLSLTGTTLDGIDAAKEIRLRTDSKIIILSSHEDELTVLNASTACFASGYIFKSNHGAILSVIKETARGTSPMEIFVLGQLIGKLSDAERAVFNSILNEDVILKSSPKTIANQKTEVFRKLGVKNKNELLHIFNASVNVKGLYS